LHTLASGHEEPSGRGEVRQPTVGLQLSVVHGLPSLQARGVPAMHMPVWQVSAPLHTLASGHEEPSGTTGLLQAPSVQMSLVHGLPSAQSAFTTQGWHVGICVFWQPLTGVQVSVVQALPSLQSRAVPALQTPFWQVSVPLQTLESAQEVPFSTGVLAHPKTGSQVSVVQELPSLQSRTVPALQTPFWQVSVPLQTLVSSHGVPFDTGVFVQPVDGLQLSVVQMLLSLQLSAVPGVQVPFWQVSVPLQKLPSLHEVPSATEVVLHPKTGSQVSVVQGLLSLQLSAVPGVQVPL
jgi:hypothetical protein